MYRDYFGRPLSNKAHDLLHTHYHEQGSVSKLK
ncbi:MAG: iron hydrogenase small subunit [Oscillospiraceae bacterium]